VARQNLHSLRDEPLQVVALVPLGSKLRQMRVKGQLYWFARTPARPGVKSRRVYVGSDAAKAIVERAWAIVGAELAQLEATPEGRKLRELEALATSSPRLARTIAKPVVIELPQLELALVAGGRAGRRRPKR